MAAVEGAETAKAATARLERDTELYRRIKEGMREYHWRAREQTFSSRNAKTGDLLFETAHLSAFHVDHFAEFRVGFYFKDLDEYGLYGFFDGDGSEFESYYRTDSTFQKEEMLLTNDED